MTAPRDPSGTDRPSGGEVPPAGRRPAAPALDRAPGERYRRTAPVGGDAPRPRSFARGLLAGALVAAVAAVIVALVAQIDLTTGFLGIAVAAGWATGLAVRWGSGGAGAPGRRVAAAAVLAAVGLLAGLLLESVIARTGLGVLDPVSYLAQRFGAIALVVPVLGAAAAALRAR